MTSPKNDKNTRTTGRPTLNEVARLAGVSPITASRALRGLQQVCSRYQSAQIRQDRAHAFAAASGQRYLSALIFVWQAAR
jgi:hypothetical protein